MVLRVTGFTCLCLLYLTTCHATTWDKTYWYSEAQTEITNALNRQKNLNTGVAKNLVLLIGDGMGVTTTTAARVLKGQRNPDYIGEEALMSWDKFPFTGNSKTYTTNVMTTDSAASGTAYHCGVKTKYRAIGVDDNVKISDCSSVEKAKVLSVLDRALAAGKSVGIVTTDQLVGASPAAAYAHSAHRDWKTDDDLPKSAKSACKDIARQLVEDNLDIQVLLGGGRNAFTPKQTMDPERPDKKGGRKDGMDLMQKWLSSQVTKGRKAKLVMNKAEFDAADVDNTDYLMGVFEPKRMLEETIRRENNSEPSISEMTEKAVKILSKNPKGFYLFVEGANIDKGHHMNRARYALEETLAFNMAVEKVRELTSSKDTLVVVSADHSHTFSFGGYSDRGQSILSIANSTTKNSKDELGNYYTILSYGNGPGYKKAQRHNLTDKVFEEDQYYMANFPLDSETHGGEDVQIFASGPMSHMFTGTHEQVFIAHGMAYAACIDDHKKHCEDQDDTSPSITVSCSFVLVALTSLLTSLF